MVKFCWISVEQGLTFPQGESHEGSPGLEAFHRAKSLGDFFSLNLSAEMLRSPTSTDRTHNRLKTKDALKPLCAGFEHPGWFYFSTHKNVIHQWNILPGGVSTQNKVKPVVELYKNEPSPSCKAFWSPTASGTSLAYECCGLPSNLEVLKYTEPFDSYLSTAGTQQREDDLNSPAVTDSVAVLWIKTLLLFLTHP